jgi:hypothetical protein
MKTVEGFQRVLEQAAVLAYTVGIADACLSCVAKVLPSAATVMAA